MGTPLNLVLDLLMVLGATTSSMCSICSYAYTQCIDDERFYDMGGTYRCDAMLRVIPMASDYLTVGANFWAVKEIRPQWLLSAQVSHPEVFDRS